jgi:hypothetical protein
LEQTMRVWVGAGAVGVCEFRSVTGTWGGASPGRPRGSSCIGASEVRVVCPVCSLLFRVLAIGTSVRVSLVCVCVGGWLIVASQVHWTADRGRDDEEPLPVLVWAVVLVCTRPWACSLPSLATLPGCTHHGRKAWRSWPGLHVRRRGCPQPTLGPGHGRGVQTGSLRPGIRQV